MEQTRNPVVIAGAGPYGVSIGAHLAAAGVDFRIFGKPIYRWRCQMPRGMYLKSEGCASSLSDAAGERTLARYCGERRLSYGEWGKPVSLELFVDYALDFQRRLVPNVEETMIASIERRGREFELRMADDSVVTAGKVVVATGLDYLAHVPDALANLPRELVSHSSQHHDLSRFKGREVIVLGGGQSAIEIAVLLADAGASVRLMARKPALAWNPPPKHARRSAYQRFRHPASGLGVGVELWTYCRAPHLFRHFSREFRARKVATVLGPAGAWWLKERLAGRVQILPSHAVESARARDGRVLLRVAREGGSRFEHAADHVIAATGYRFTLDRLRFLSPRIRADIRLENGMPALSPGFESSVAGLHFAGFASAMSFGPAMRFIYGADFTAARLTRELRGRSAFGAVLAPPSRCNV